MRPENKVIHFFHDPFGARVFIEPVLEAIIAVGIRTELWKGLDDKWGLEGKVHSSGIPSREFSFDLPYNPFTAAWRLAIVWHALWSERPAAVHAHLTRGATIPLLAAWLAGVKIRIYHNHGMAHLGRKRFEHFALRSLEIINHFLATHAIMVSRSNKSAAIADRIPGAERTIVFGYGSINGVDLQKFKPASEAERQLSRKELGIPEESLIIGFQGRASAHKGLSDLVRAFDLASLADQNIRVIAAGTNATQAGSLLDGKLPPWLACLGAVHDMPLFYRSCDLIVMPSWYEGLGLAVVEAAACGVPAIASDVPGLQCTMQPELTGLLVPARDPEVLAKALRKMTADGELRRKMGFEARRFVEERFDRSKVLGETVEWTMRVLEDASFPHRMKTPAAEGHAAT